MKNFLLGSLLALSFPSLLFAGTFTLSTTYPSPNGNYKTLEAQNVGIGTAASANYPLLVFGGNVGIGTTTSPGQLLDVEGGNIGIGPAYGYYLGAVPIAYGKPTLNSYYFGGAGNSTSTGMQNAAMGYQAMLSNTAGIQNTAVGYQALFSNLTGEYNTAMGQGAMYSTLNNFNTAMGEMALQGDVLTGDNGIGNTAMGARAIQSNDGGSYNSALGFTALQNNTTGGGNSAVGYQALGNNNTGSNNSAMGYQALLTNTAGADNAAMGYQALYTNNAGNQNVAVGHQALYTNGANWNTAVGYQALYNDTFGLNTAVGYLALYNNTNASNNVALGAWAGEWFTGGNPNLNQTSSNSTYIGTDTLAQANGDTNETVIGYQATGAGSNSVTLGNTLVTTTVLQGNVNIGNGGLTVSQNETITGNLTVNGAGGITAPNGFYYSDERLKKNIHNIDHALDKVERLNGVTFNWKKDGKKDSGVIAQNVEKVFPELVGSTTDGIKTVKYGNLVGVLIEAVKEQQKEIEDLKQRVSILELRGHNT